MDEREKIINIIQSVKFCEADSGCGGCKYETELDNYSYVACRTLRIADALIAANIGDVTEWKKRAEKHRVQILLDGTIKQLYSDEEVEDIARQRDEYKHRAEVAERALLTACVNLIKDEEDDVNMELLARAVYMKFLRKAEKRT